MSSEAEEYWQPQINIIMFGIVALITGLREPSDLLRAAHSVTLTSLMFTETLQFEWRSAQLPSMSDGALSAAPTKL